MSFLGIRTTSLSLSKRNSSRQIPLLSQRLYNAEFKFFHPNNETFAATNAAIDPT